MPFFIIVCDSDYHGTVRLRIFWPLYLFNCDSLQHSWVISVRLFISWLIQLVCSKPRASSSLDFSHSQYIFSIPYLYAVDGLFPSRTSYWNYISWWLGINTSFRTLSKLTWISYWIGWVSCLAKNIAGCIDKSGSFFLIIYKHIIGWEESTRSSPLLPSAWLPYNGLPTLKSPIIRTSLLLRSFRSCWPSHHWVWRTGSKRSVGDSCVLVMVNTLCAFKITATMSLEP